MPTQQIEAFFAERALKLNVRSLRSERSHIPLILGIFLFVHSLFVESPAAEAGRGSESAISLDGSWQIAEGRMDQIPEKFDRTVQVPGLA